MGNLMTSFNAGVSGLHSAQASLNTTAHNLANAQTKGYSRQQVIITDSFYQNSISANDDLMQVGTGTTIVKTRQVRNTFIDGQYRLQVGREYFYRANSEATAEIEDMLGELQGEEFSTCISDLWTALSSLANEAENVVYKDKLVSVASQFIERAQVLQGQLNAYQTSLNTEIMNQVDSINNIVAEIKHLNKEIQKYEATGEDANDYRDKRNELLDELSQYINYEVNELVDGTITIYTEGAYLLDSASQYFVEVAYEEYGGQGSKLLKPVWATGENFFINETLLFSSANNSDIGSLKGLMVARGNKPAVYTDVPTKPKMEDFADEADYKAAMNQYEKDVEQYNETVGASVIMTVQSQLDMLVHGIVTNVNDVLCQDKELTLADGTTIRVLDEENALIGDDKNKTMGTELFSRRGTERYEKVTVTVENEDGTTSDIEVYKYNEESKDPQTQQDYYTLYTLDQLVVNPTVLQDSSTIPVMYNDQSDKRGGYANTELLAIANSFNEKVGTLNPNSLTEYDVFNYYDAMVGELGTQGNVWNGIIANQEITVTSLESERQNVMGVSTDEELSDLIKFQRCYDASSRYITTISEMLEYIIEKLGG